MAKKYLIPLLCFLSLGSALAEEDSARMTAQEFEASLAYRQGDVVLSNGIATLKIPRTFRYLGPDDAQRVLEQAWGNPQGSGTLGMLFRVLPVGVRDGIKKIIVELITGKWVASFPHVHPLSPRVAPHR